MKKLNRYLLTHYPQLWNLKLGYILPAIALVHALMYLLGYMSLEGFKELHVQYKYANPMFRHILPFTMAGGIFMLIYWLVFYLRNNPFKSFYPVNRWYFVIEFCFVMIVFMGALCFERSYRAGYAQAVRHETADVNAIEEANTLNLAYALMPHAPDKYRLHARCDSVDYIDALHRKRDTLEEIVEVRYGDSAQSYFTPEYLGKSHDLLLLQYDSLRTIIDAYKAREDDTNYNYLNYCGQYHDYYFYKQRDSSLRQIYDHRQIAERIHTMLITHDTAAVAAILGRFEKMCIRYEIDRSVSPSAYRGPVFRYADFHIDDFLINPPQREVERERHSAGKWLSFNEVTVVLENIQEVRTMGWELKYILRLLYAGFVLALVLFSFRLSTLRTWFIAMTGSFVLCVIISVMWAFISYTLTFYVSMLALAIAFQVLYFVFRAMRRKLLSGICLIWLTWALPLIGLVTLTMLLKCFPYDEVTQTMPPMWLWLDRWFNPLLAVYGLTAFVYAITVLPALYRRWQAMAEE